MFECRLRQQDRTVDLARKLAAPLDLVVNTTACKGEGGSHTKGSRSQSTFCALRKSSMAERERIMSPSTCRDWEEDELGREEDEVGRERLSLPAQVHKSEMRKKREFSTCVWAGIISQREGKKKQSS